MHILFHITISNYLLLCLWAYRYTKFEVETNPFFKFENCQICMLHFKKSFSVRMLKMASVCNLSFGYLIGIYLTRKSFYLHKGFFHERDVKKYLLRMLIFCLFFAPLVIGYKLQSNNPIFEFGKLFVLSLFTGILLGSVFFKFLHKLGLGLSHMHREPARTELEIELAG